MSDFVHISRLHPDPANARKTFRNLDELAASIRVQGILEPLIVQPHPHKPGNWMIVAGERRFRAAKIARLDEIPVILRNAAGPATTRVLNLVENLHRDDLTPIEKCEALREFIRDGWTQAAIARATGLSPATVSSILSLDELDAGTKARVQSGQVRVGVARAAIRTTRAKTAKAKGHKPRQPVRVDPPHFGDTHPLFKTATIKCELAGHTAPKVGKDRDRRGPCGPCMEQAIREDDRAQRRVPLPGLPTTDATASFVRGLAAPMATRIGAAS